jgi:DNA-directed RNA polymerase subunit RPC12/RpoP
LLFQRVPAIFIKYHNTVNEVDPTRERWTPRNSPLNVRLAWNGLTMEIRFTCSACRTVMKLGDMITEQKKVRCSGCGTVILIEPNPDNPREIITSIPKRRDKPKGMSEAMRRNILIGIAVALILIVVIGVWWTQFSGPSLTAAVEGDVKLDGAPLVKGKIVFTPLDTSKGARAVSIPIERGSYSARASRGPAIGTNKVQIFGSETEIVAPRYHTPSEDDDPLEEVNIQPGVNKLKPFETLSK